MPKTMIRRRFPKVEILPRNLCTHREVAPEAIRPYFDRADLYLHGSGPNPMAVVQLQQWIDLTGKPYGFGGITVPNLTIAPPEMLSRAAFIFCRDTHSLDFLRTNGIASPVLAMAHGTPALHIRQQEDTHKAQMYRDLGLDDWIFEIDGTDGEDVARELLSIHANHAAAVARVTATNGRIAAGHEQMITSAIRKTVRDG